MAANNRVITIFAFSLLVVLIILLSFGALGDALFIGSLLGFPLAVMGFQSRRLNYQKLPTLKPTDAYTITIDGAILSAAVNYAYVSPPLEWYLPDFLLHDDEAGTPFNFAIEISKIKTFETDTRGDWPEYGLRSHDGERHLFMDEEALQAVRAKLKDIPHKSL